MAVDDGLANHIAIGVRRLVGALYLTDLASKTRRGLAGKLAQGQRAGGLPYGYRPIAGRPGRRIAHIPRLCGGLFAARYLGVAERRPDRPARGRAWIAPARGRAWNASTIHGSAKRASGMIANEVYRGVIVWNR